MLFPDVAHPVVHRPIKSKIVRMLLLRMELLHVLSPSIMIPIYQLDKFNLIDGKQVSPQQLLVVLVELGRPQSGKEINRFSHVYHRPQLGFSPSIHPPTQTQQCIVKGG